MLLQNNQISGGMVNLSGMHVARLKDEISADHMPYLMRLDGFTYDAFSSRTDISLNARLPWLRRRPEGAPFVAQPYAQLADILTRVGHREAARSVLMVKERLLRQENRTLLRQNEGLGLGLLRAWLVDETMRVMVGYGYRPARAVVLALGLIFAFGVFFEKTWHAGDMAPNAAPILVSQPWIEATVTHPGNPAKYWSGAGEAGQDWETFNGYAYAADLLIPLVSLGQEEAWAPSTTRSSFGRHGWWLRWVAKVLGWVVTELGAAALTGLIRQDCPKCAPSARDRVWLGRCPKPQSFIDQEKQWVGGHVRSVSKLPRHPKRLEQGDESSPHPHQSQYDCQNLLADRKPYVHV